MKIDPKGLEAAFHVAPSEWRCRKSHLEVIENAICAYLSTVTSAEVGEQRCDHALISSISLLRSLGRDDEVVHVAIAELEFARSRLATLEAQAAELAALANGMLEVEGARIRAVASFEKSVEALERARHELWEIGASESEHNALWHIRRALAAGGNNG